jgi:hypothetical protein
MALRNTLLVCSAIVAGGGIAGVSMQPRPNLPAYDTSSNSFGAAQSPADPAPTYGASQPDAAPSSGSQPPYGQTGSYGQASQYGPPQQYDQQQQNYGQQAQGYGQQTPSYGPPQQSDPAQSYGSPPYGGPSQQAGLQQQYGQAQYGPPQSNGSQGSYGPQGAYGPPGSYGAPPSAASRPNDPQMVALTQMEQADRILPRMPVESANGRRMGEVAQVRMENGYAREVVLDQGLRIPASDLMYVPSRSVLIAQASMGGSPTGYGSTGYGPPNGERGRDRSPYGQPNQQGYPSGSY